MTYLRSVLGSAVDDVRGQRILGTLWNYHNDNLLFDFTKTASLAKGVEPTKSIWQRLVTQLQGVKPLTLARCYYAGTEGEVIVGELHGFCDASAKAYGAVVFPCNVTTCTSYVRFVSSETRVAPLSEQNIPRLELLSAVVLSRLIHTLKEALSSG